MQKTLNKKWTIILSIIFAVVNITAFKFSIINWKLHYEISAILFCIYIVSSVILKKKTDCTDERIGFIQLGGIAVFIAAAIMFIYFIISYILDFGISSVGWAILTAGAIAGIYVITVILPLGLNLMIFYIYGLFAAAKKRRKIN